MTRTSTSSDGPAVTLDEAMRAPDCPRTKFYLIKLAPAHLDKMALRKLSCVEIKAAIRRGVRDINQLKALTRVGMGACGSKTCRPMIWRIFQEEGIDLGTVTDRVDRPLFVEVPLGILAGKRKGGRLANK